jgi:uncharacterized protein (DUF1015 family)
MAEIFPFRGLRYNLEKLAKEGVSLDSVVTPPYDVIDEAQQDAFYARHPANFVRVDLNRKTPEDNAGNNPYTRAAAFIEQWEKDGTLVAEEEPAFYAYSQTWTQDGETVERKGMIALLKLGDFESGVVLPHEYTLKGPKQDRLDLMRSTLCSLSQVFLIYSDPAKTMEGLLFNEQTGWAEATDADGVRHRFKPVTEPGVISRLQALFKDKSLLIADGHHRYETALAYKQEVREQIRRETGQEPPEGSLLSDYGMIFLTNMDDPGLKVYPTHRVLYRWPEGWDQGKFEEALAQRFDVVTQGETFSYRKAGTQVLIRLRLKPEAKPAGLPPLLDSFDAALLEETVFKGIFQSGGEALKQAHVLGFYRNEDEINTLWEKQKAVAAFYLAAPSVHLVRQICESGHRMPQKSTYFYPKILSGLVVYPYRRFLQRPAHALSGVCEAEPVESAAQPSVVS